MWFRRALPWLFALAIAANLFELASLTILPWNGGMYGIDGKQTSPGMWRITALDKQSRASGLLPGDLIDLREPSNLNRGYDANYWLETKPFIVVAHRGNRTFHASVALTHTPMSWDDSIRLIAVFWVIGFAFLIFKKGRSVKENDYLTLILLLLAVQSPIDRTAIPYNGFAFAYTFLDNAFQLACVALAIYGAQFGRPLAGSRKALLYLSVAVNVVACFSRWFRDVVMYIAPVVDLSGGIYYWLIGAGIVLPIFFGLLAVADAIRYAPQTERQRLAWVVAAFIPWFIGVTFGATLSGGWYTVENVSFFFIPAALTYAALSRRLFDIGFVLNRAAVFAGVSAVVVGVFVLAEWALSEWLRDASHITNLAASGALALALGLSVRFVHTRVDRFVDVVFFRKRHDDERALRTFAHEAPYITNAATLLHRTHDIVQQHTGAQHVTVLQCDALGPIDENDPALVALRASRKPLELHDLQTDLRGEIAFPMVARGRLVGALVLGPKASHESYAPDESAALVEIAHSVGLSLDVLAGSRTPGSDALEEIRSTNQRILDVLLTMQNTSLETR